MKESTPFHPERILCPVDFSALSDLALKYAAAGARAFGSTLTIFHAQRFTLPPYFTRAQIAELTRQHRAEQAKARDYLKLRVRKVLGSQATRLPLKFDLTDAHPVDAILGAVKRHRADLIVMGTHGRGGAKRLWLGSVAENVARQAGVPVFIVRQKQHDLIDASDPQSEPKLATILCPVNFTRTAQVALDHAASIARRFDARLVTACVMEPDDPRTAADVSKELDSWMAKRTGPQCDLQTLTRRGDPAGQIVALAGKTKADLIVLGAQLRSSLRAWLWGDTTEFVLRNAPVPVLLVPQ